MPDHQYLEGAGQITHHTIDERLPSAREKSRLAVIGVNAPAGVSGARDDPEGALKALLAALEGLGLIEDSTTAT